MDPLSLAAILILGASPALLISRISPPSKEVGLGAALLLVTLVIQPPIQLVGKRILSGLPFLIYAAAVSGLLQEGLKLLAVRTNRNALWLGYGFGLAETVLVVLNGIVAALMGFETPLAYWAALERLSATLFHTGSVPILRLRYGYPAMAFVHALINFIASYYVSIGVLSRPELVPQLYALIVPISLAVFLAGLKVVRNE